MSSNDGTFSQRKYYVVNYLLVPRVCIEKKISTMYLQYCANHLSLQYIVICTSCFKLKNNLKLCFNVRIALDLSYRFHFFFDADSGTGKEPILVSFST